MIARTILPSCRGGEEVIREFLSGEGVQMRRWAPLTGHYSGGCLRLQPQDGAKAIKWRAPPNHSGGRLRMTVAKPKRADALRNHEKLLAAAREAFTEHGASASLEDIARRAGVGIGTLYRHFPTRQALVEAVYFDEVEALGR